MDQSAVGAVHEALDSHVAAHPMTPLGTTFCAVWPQAGPILQGLTGLLQFVPSYGTAASAALNALLLVGQQVYDQQCKGGSD